MPTMINLWMCDLCCTRWGTESLALSCEARGLPPELPPGLLVYTDDGAGGSCLVVRALERQLGNAHVGHYRSAAFYDILRGGTLRPFACYGDRVGDGALELGPYPSRCWTDPSLRRLAPVEPHPHPGPVDTTAPAYERAHAYALALGLAPTVWVNGRAQPAPAPEGRRLR